MRSILKMKINKGFKYRLNPNKEQEISLKQQGGNTRFLWNYLLKDNMNYYQKTGKFKFYYEISMSLPKLKKQYQFLNLSYSQSLQQVGRYFDRALKDSFNKSKGFPIFKSKHKLNDSFTIPQKFRLSKGFVFIPKVGEVNWVKHRPLQGKPKHITISQDGNQWFCSVLCEIEIKDKKKKKDNIVGIDVGLKSFAVFSNNTIIDNPKHLRKQEIKLAKAQKLLSRKVIGSKNREKQKIKVQKVYKNIRNTRNNFQHKLTHDMITKYDGFVFEDLNVFGMLKNRCLAKSISDVGWYDFKRKIKYKSLWNFKYFVEIDRFDPTSKICSSCGWKNEDLTLKDRTFKCKSCGNIIDRDLNASINIRNYGLNILRDTEECDSLTVRTLGEKSPLLVGNVNNKQEFSLNQEKEFLHK